MSGFVSIERESEIRKTARSLLNDMWRKRDQIWSVPPPFESLIPIPLEVIIRRHLQIRLEEPETIPPETTGAEIAGVVDRGNNLIAVAQRYKPDYRRFTMAHELGHWIIHPDGLYHRDRLLSGGERANGARPMEEHEADIFAAELTMPSKPVTDYFRQGFGDTIGSALSPSLVRWLSAGNVNEIEFWQSRRQRALTVAGAASSGPGCLFVPLNKKFGVSRVAMAIHLEDLSLVT